MGLNRQGKIILLLLVLLALAVGYIALDKYNKAREQEQLGILQQGVQIGYQQAILQVMQQASTCQQVPLFAGNQTLSLVAVGCLQQG